MGVVDGYVTATNENVYGKKDFYDGFKTSELVEKNFLSLRDLPGKNNKGCLLYGIRYRGWSDHNERCSRIHSHGFTKKNGRK